MSDSTDRVLASIDEAVAGYVSEDLAVSDDAMRWRPEAVAEVTEGDRAARERHSGWSDALRQALNLHRAVESGELTPRWTNPNASGGSGTSWAEFGHTTEGGFVYARPVPRFAFGGLVPDPEAATRSTHELLQAMTAGLDQVSRAFGVVGEVFKAQADRSHVQIAPRLYGDDYRWHRRACRLCNPAGNPKPLAGNGADYRRRTRARRRRNRR